MKKFVLKSLVVAIASLGAGSVLADVNLGTGVTTVKFASELDFSSATGAAITGGKTVITPLGFGVSGSQDRYIRIDLVGAKLAAASGAGNTPSNGGTQFDNRVLVAGGAVGDTYAIYQVTADAAGHSSVDQITIALPNLHVTNGNTASPTVQYRLYETAVAAVNAGDSLSSKSGAIFSFAKGLDFTVTKGANEAKVAESYKKLNDPAVTGPVKIGEFTYGTVAGVKGADGATDVPLTSLVTAASKVVFTGDFAAANNGANPPVFNGLAVNTAAATCPGATTLTLNAGRTSADLTVGTTAVTAGALCLTVSGKDAVTEQTDSKGSSIKAALDITAVAGTGTQDVAALTIGEITRDGTELQSPWFSTSSGYLSRFFLTSTHSADAAYTTRVITENGNTCTAGSGATGTLPAGKQLAIEASSICSSFSGATRAAVIFTIAAPTANIQGIYNLVNATTGSAAAAPLLRPGTN